MTNEAIERDLDETVERLANRAAIARDLEATAKRLATVLPLRAILYGVPDDGSARLLIDACSGCGGLLSAHEKTTGKSDCFGCRVARRKGGAR